MKEQYSTYNLSDEGQKNPLEKLDELQIMTPFFVFSFDYVMSFFNLKEEKTLSQDSEYVNEEVPDVVAGPSWLKKCSRWTFFKFDYLPTDKVVIQNKPSLMCSHYSSELLKKNLTD